MKNGVRSPPSVEAALLMAKTARGSCRSQSSLRPLAKAPSVSPDDAVGPLRLGVGVLVVGRADDEARAHAHDAGPERRAREFGNVTHHDEHVGETVAGAEAHVANDRRRIRRRRRGARGNGMYLARQRVDVVLDHVETTCRRRQPGNPVHPNHPAPPRGAVADGAGRGVRRAPPRPWSSGTCAHTRGHRGPARSRRRGGAPATPSWRVRNAPLAGRRDTRGAPARAARRQRGCKDGLSRPALGGTADRNGPGTSRPSACRRSRGPRQACRAGPLACRAPPPHRA
mmetsp:Transcript_42108/g.88028  ORF Transcript_42108/g.88028 Transcript_42108/m.88028 type:complete len:284 (-) Transcript_42108:2188-3039(-)